LSGDYGRHLNGIDEIYVMTIARGTVPSNPDIEQEIEKRILKKLQTTK
jgi:hypothetical protein